MNKNNKILIAIIIVLIIIIIILLANNNSKQKNNKNINKVTYINISEKHDNNEFTNNVQIDKNNTNDTYESYIEEIEQNINDKNTNYSLSEKIKEGFISLADFLFYGGTINGKTFEELSDSAKLKVIKAFITIDSKIDKHFPGYKETISSNGTEIYTNLKEKALELYSKYTTKICENNSSLCISAKNDFSKLKENFAKTWDTIKDKGTIGIEKIKNWYEVWRDEK